MPEHLPTEVLLRRLIFAAIISAIMPYLLMVSEKALTGTLIFLFFLFLVALSYRDIAVVRYVLTLAVIGVILLSLTLFYQVNPAEGSVVDEKVLGTPFHYFLLFTTMPAWIAGDLLAFGTFLRLPLMFLVQIIIFSFFAYLLYLVRRAVALFNIQSLFLL